LLALIVARLANPSIIIEGAADAAKAGASSKKNEIFISRQDLCPRCI
jgi:hypothetical protein